MEKIGGNVKIKKIAVCGGIASGKSTVCDLLEHSGAYSLKADDIVHDLLSSNESVIQQIVDHFGKRVQKEGSIDRKKLAELVFNDKKALDWLESLLHPKVIAIIKETYKKVEAKGDYSRFVVEFPLLFEIGFDAWFDTILVIEADEPLRQARFLKKGFSEEQFHKRSERFLKKIAINNSSITFVKNNGSLEALEKNLNQVLC